MLGKKAQAPAPEPVSDAPVYVPYPKWVTDKAGVRRIVQDADEHKAACGSLKE
jgi:hypothetical protein